MKEIEIGLYRIFELTEWGEKNKKTLEQLVRDKGLSKDDVILILKSIRLKYVR